jgi:hypothetical protein
MRHDKALARSTTKATAAPNFGGTWINELNSSMTLHVQGAEISGTYTSAVSGGGGPVSGDLSGYVNGNLISFVVNWPSSITAWVGHLVQEDGEDVIETLWQMTRMSRIRAILPNFGNPCLRAPIGFIARK